MNQKSVRISGDSVDGVVMFKVKLSLPVTVILFDALNMPALDDFQHGKRDLVKFLRTLRPGDPVAL